MILGKRTKSSKKEDEFSDKITAIASLTQMKQSSR